MNARHSPRIEFLRHGTPVGGTRYRGNAIDDPLSETGWQQMWQSLGDDTDWDRIVTSPMQRCRAFAEAFAERHGIACVIEPNLVEVGFGDWEGKTKQQLRQQDSAFFTEFYRDAVSNRPRGAEDLELFRTRVVSVVDGLLEQYQTERVLVVGHAGIMRMVMAQYLRIPLAGIYRLNIGYAARLTLLPGDPPRLKIR